MDSVTAEKFMENQQKSHQEINDILDVYMTHEWSTGLVFFKPNGTKIWRALEKYMLAEYKKRGFDEVITPRLVNAKLYRKSGHFEKNF